MIKFSSIDKLQFFNFIEQLQIILIFVVVFYVIGKITHWLSYTYLKLKILRRQNWDLNICCGQTNGGGINADIKKYADLPNFVLIDDVYHLPFPNKKFKFVLCSHTIEHLENPQKFHQELLRVGEKITYILPPLWDVTAVFNFLEHKWIFLTMRKEHTEPPAFIRLPFADFIQKSFGQRIKS